MLMLTPAPQKKSTHVALEELFQFRCSWRWVGASVALGTLVAMALRYRRLRGPVLGMLGMAGVASGIYATMIEPRQPVLERAVLRIPALPPALAGLRIGHLSDFHLGWWYAKGNTRWAVQQMQTERPDMLVLTGDFVSFRHAIPDLPDLLRPLSAPLGVYAVTGNHDYWEGVEEIRQHVEPLGIEFLVNAHKHLRWHDEDIWLIGIDDIWYGKPDIDEALAGVPSDAFKLLLSHSPDFADNAAHHHVAAQFSGHTHGGHISLPLLGWLCVPLHGMRYIAGVEQVGAMQLYVSRGLGGMPMRLRCRPEAAIVTLASW